MANLIAPNLIPIINSYMENSASVLIFKWNSPITKPIMLNSTPVFSVTT